jgi:hypothetical protein
MIQLPMAIGTQSKKVVQSIYNGHARVFLESLDRSNMANLEVLGVTAYIAALRSI